jgi:hypothetical protein
MKPLTTRQYLVLVIILAVIAVIATGARASGDCNGNQNCSSNQDVTLSQGDLVGGKTSPVTVIAPGLGDVDIAQCLGSEQFSLLVGAKQNLVLNHVCMAEFYLKIGRYDLAAQSLCNQREILKEYDNEAACEAQHDFTPVSVSESAAFIAHEQIEGRHSEEIVQVQLAQAQIVEQLNEMQRRINEPRPRVAQAVKPAFTEEQKAKAWALLVGEDEDDE